MATHPIVERTASFAKKKRLLPAPHYPLIVGVSGGVDSMVLLAVLTELGHRPVVVHVNYKLRGEASDADEVFVREHTAQLGLPVIVRTFDTHAVARERGQSIQAVARELRYEVFLDAALEHGARHVAVAHHADDQAETVLLNLLRGAGPEGLAGMPARRRLGDGVVLVRPLLHLKRGEIIDYARQKDIAWREDASNLSSAYRRSVLRHEILPTLEEHFGGDVSSRIVRSAGLMRQYVDTSLRPETERRFEACRSDAPDDTVLNADALLAQPRVWRRRILLQAAARWLGGSPQGKAPRTHATAAALDRLLRSQAGRRLEIGGGEVWREQAVIRFVRSPEESADEAVIESIPGEALVGCRRIAVETVDHLPDDLRALHPENHFAEYIDADRIKLPLTIRPWRDGDRLQPLGMSGSQKVSDVLTDARVPSSRRRREIVVEDADGIVWLVGHRIANRVRISPSTTRPAVLRVLTVS